MKIPVFFARFCLQQAGRTCIKSTLHIDPPPSCLIFVLAAVDGSVHAHAHTPIFVPLIRERASLYLVGVEGPCLLDGCLAAIHVLPCDAQAGVRFAEFSRQRREVAITSPRAITAGSD